MFGRVIETRVKWTPPLELRPENLLVSSQGGRDNKAHAITFGDTLVIEQQHGQRRPRRLQQDRHPPHPRADRVFGARRGREHLQLSRGLPARERHRRRLSARGRHRERSAVHHSRLAGQRRPHHDSRLASVRLRRQHRALDLAIAGQRAFAGPVHLQRHDHRPAARRLPHRQPGAAHSSHAELARHAPALSRSLCPGHLEDVVEKRR